MTEQMKRRTIAEFFTAPRPLVHTRTLVVGACIAFLGLLSGVSGDRATGLVIVGVGIALCLLLPLRIRKVYGEPENEAQYVSLLRYPGARHRYRARVSSEQVTTWLMEDIGRIQKTSRELLGLDETTRDPICVIGPLYSEQVAGIDPDLVLRRRLPEGYLYSSYRISVFHFTDTLLGSYQANFSLVQGIAAAEQTGEFFYRDVVAVRTLTESSKVTLKSGETLEHSRTFVLTLTSGDRIAVVFDDPVIRSGNRIRSLSEEAVNNIRAMLRQYKVLAPET
jgi:hypothetical protein